MSEFVLSCCSTADLSKEHFESRGIEYVCFHYNLGGTDYPDDLGHTVPFKTFYQRMVNGEDTRTSQVNVEEYIDYFKSFLEQGKDVFHLSLSSGLSGSYNSARNAAELLKEEYPHRKIYVLDSLGASSGFGLLIDKLADLRDEGKSMDEIKEWVENNRLNLHHWFFSTDLTFYIKGGRVSKVAGFFGGMLGICPLLNMNNLGKLIAREKIRSKRKVIERIVDKMEKHAKGGLNYSGKCYICHSDCLEDAQAVKALVEERFPNLNGEVEINWIGTTIGSHTGPGTVALFFWGDERVE
ncbi:MAG: DegV family protein [Clostridia bacterium]|nr:DegV family protein [Clostridia bacterium]